MKRRRKTRYLGIVNAATMERIAWKVRFAPLKRIASEWKKCGGAPPQGTVNGFTDHAGRVIWLRDAPKKHTAAVGVHEACHAVLGGIATESCVQALEEAVCNILRITLE